MNVSITDLVHYIIQALPCCQGGCTGWNWRENIKSLTQISGREPEDESVSLQGGVECCINKVGSDRDGQIQTFVAA